MLTNMGHTDREAQLTAAGWRVIDALSLPNSLGGFTAAQVCREAGVSTGSLFHHFTSMEALAEAMLADLSEDPRAYTEPTWLGEAARDVNVLDLVKHSTTARWKRHTSDPERLSDFRHELLGILNHSQPLPQEQPATALNPERAESHMDRQGSEQRLVGDVMRSRFAARQQGVNTVWTDVLRSVGRTVVEPFTADRLTTGVTAIFTGLALRHMFDPDSVDEELLADLTSTLIAGLSKPLGSDRDLATVAEAFGRPVEIPATPQARSGARRRAETRAQIVSASVGLFNSGWEQVTALEVAEHAGVSSQTISNVFGDVRTLAANTFAVHMDTIAAATEAALRKGRDPQDMSDALTVIAAALAALAGCAIDDPGPARALLSERLATIRRTGEAVSTGDIRVEVPVTREVLPILERFWPDHNALVLARTLTHCVLAQAVLEVGDPREIADQVMRMLPEPDAAMAPRE